MRRFLSGLLLFGVATAASADEKYLLPVVFDDPVPGAFGSLWASTFAVHNKSDELVYVNLVGPCPFECQVQVSARSVVEGVPGLAPFIGKNGPGDFFFLSAAAEGRVALSLRVQDLSRQELSWGTEIPVIPESKALTRESYFVNVPTDIRFRQMLRIYDFDSRENAVVKVSIYAPDGTLLDRRNLALALSDIESHRRTRPGYAEIGWLTAAFPGVVAYEKVTVQLEPVTPDLRYWAFVSVTHNESQHVTVITPASE